MIPGLCNLFQTVVGSSGGLSVHAAPSMVEKIGNGTITTASITATPSGGTPAYTYLWQFQGGDASISPDTGTAATTTFTATVNPGDNISAYYSCQVTDSAARVASSNQVTVQFSSN